MGSSQKSDGNRSRIIVFGGMFLVAAVFFGYIYFQNKSAESLEADSSESENSITITGNNVTGQQIVDQVGQNLSAVEYIDLSTYDHTMEAFFTTSDLNIESSKPVVDHNLQIKRTAFAKAIAPGSPVQTKWKTHNQFLVHRIVTDLWQIAEYSQRNNPNSIEPGNINVTELFKDPYDITSMFLNLQIDEHPKFLNPIKISLYSDCLYHPNSWKTILRDLGYQVDESKRDNASSLNSFEDFLGDLNTLDHEQIEYYNRQLSRLLEGNIHHYQAHVRAACLLGIQALNETAGSLKDKTFYLSRMAVHLTVADTLHSPNNSPFQLERDFAELLFDYHMGRSLDIEEDVAKLQGKGSFLDEWIFVTTFKSNTLSDADPFDQDRTDLENFEYLQWLYSTSSQSKFGGFYDRKPPFLTFDNFAVYRVLASGNPSVTVGRFIEKVAMNYEVNAFESSYKNYFNAREIDGDSKDSNIHWNTEPKPIFSNDRNIKLNIIDWGMWANYHQRHLINGSKKVHQYWKDVALGQRATEFKNYILDTYEDLYLVNFIGVNVYSETPEDIYKAHQLQIAENPHLVPAGGWVTNPFNFKDAEINFSIDPPNPGEDNYTPNPRCERYFWFSPPPGTTTNIGLFRNYPRELHHHYNKQILAYYNKIAPNSSSLFYLNAVYRFDGGSFDDNFDPLIEQTKKYFRNNTSTIAGLVNRFRNHEPAQKMVKEFEDLIKYSEPKLARDLVLSDRWFLQSDEEKKTTFRISVAQRW